MAAHFIASGQRLYNAFRQAVTVLSLDKIILVRERASSLCHPASSCRDSSFLRGYSHLLQLHEGYKKCIEAGQEAVLLDGQPATSQSLDDELYKLQIQRRNAIMDRDSSIMLPGMLQA